MTETPETGPSSSIDGAFEGSGGAEDNESYHGYSVDDETQPQSTGDSLVDDDRDVDPMEEGWNPPEKWSVAQGYGNTPLEEELGETLDQRIAQEIPEPDPYLAAEAESEAEEDPDAALSEVGEARSGRLVDTAGGVGPDDEATLVAQDVGIDGAAATAEEAAVHVIDEIRPHRTPRRHPLTTPREKHPEGWVRSGVWSGYRRLSGGAQLEHRRASRRGSPGRRTWRADHRWSAVGRDDMDSDLIPWHHPWGAQQVVQALEDRLGTRIEPSCVGVRCADESPAPHELETPD